MADPRLTPPPATLDRWRWERPAWRGVRHLSRRHIDLMLRIGGGRRFTVDHARLLALGLPPDVVAAALDRVRSVDQWTEAWTWAANRFLGEARQADITGHPAEAAWARHHAALAYHVATWLTLDDPKALRTLRASSAAIFRRSLPETLPVVSPLSVPWRTHDLPALLAAPAGPAPVVVLLNGSSTAKEETILWAGAFLAAGLAVVALDWPGTGEAALSTGVTPDVADLVNPLRRALAGHRDHARLDPDQIALVGFSLGAVPAVRLAAADHRVRAVVAVTPPFDPLPWMHGANALLLAQLASACGGYARLWQLAPGFSLRADAARLTAPLLVLGAGRDLLVPPDESLRLARAASEHATLVWYPRASHGLYEEIADWTELAANWLAVQFGNSPESR